MKRVGIVLMVGAALLVALLAAGCGTSPASAKHDRGQYIFAASGGCRCHGPNLAGYNATGARELPKSRPFGEILSGPFGVVPAANITPDKKTGIGDWTDDEIVRAIREGVNKEGEQLHTVMPYTSFHLMADADVRDLVAYLRQVPAVFNEVPRRELKSQIAALPSLPAAPATAPKNGLDRGRYLVTAVSICGDCHTPKKLDETPDQSLYLATGWVRRDAGRYQIAPNITPDKATGIGNWTEKQIVDALRTGVLPGKSNAGGLMVAVIDGGFKQFSDSDARAIATYLKSVPAINHLPKPPDLLH